MPGLIHLRLELARSEHHPEGDSTIGYELVAPLTADGHLDAAGWSKNQEACRVRHFAGAHMERGRLVHDQNGWHFDYRKGEEDDQAVFRLDRHTLNVGDYISVREHNGRLMTYKVVSAEAA